MRIIEIVSCCILFFLIIAIACGTIFAKSRNKIVRKEFELILKENNYNPLNI